MDERLRFVARLLEGEKMAPLCAEFGISRKTGYKIFDRYKDCGLTAFTDRSRRPYRQANRLPPAIEATIASPPITASQPQLTSILSRPSTNTCFGISGSARTARASAQSEARKMLSRSIRAGEAKATAKDDVAQISSNSSSRRSAVSRLESSIPLGIRLGSSTTAAATTGPASGPRPASSQPATGQTPRLISARSRRKLGGVRGRARASDHVASAGEPQPVGVDRIDVRLREGRDDLPVGLSFLGPAFKPAST